MLVQGGWVYRAIKLYIRVFQWEKAFDLARSQQTHVDTVLYYRQKHLAMLGSDQEPIPKLAQAAQQLGAINEQAVRAKIEKEKERFVFVFDVLPIPPRSPCPTSLANPVCPTPPHLTPHHTTPGKENAGGG